MEVYTIGHSNYEIKEFIDILIKNKIDCLVDVRTTPYSKYTPQFNKETLYTFLKYKKIKYIHMGKEFGARRNKIELYSREGYLDFEKVKKDNEFLRGVKRIKEGCTLGFNIVLMCTEKDPLDCHRGILVAKGLQDNGITVNHIKDNGNIETHKELENRLLDLYYFNRNQITFNLLPESNLSIEDMLRLSYKKRNIDIGYRIKEGV